MDTNNNKQCECNKPKVVNDLLKRISNLEFDVEDKDKEIERLNNIINELEKWLKEQKDINDRTNSIIFNARGFEDRVILNKLNELKGSDNSADIRQEEIL